MSTIIAALEAEQMAGKDIPDFSPGDTVAVQVKVKEGTRERLQTFEGVVLAKRNRGLNSAFTVRKISHGEGVERTFQTYSPLIASIDVKRKGKVRRAKLYYLRELSGRKARIKEKLVDKNKAVKAEAKKPVAKKAAPKAEKVEKATAKAPVETPAKKDSEE